MLYFPRSSGRVLEVLCTVLKEEDLCGIPTAELDLVRLTVSYRAMHWAFLRGSFSPVPCLPLPCPPEWEAGVG